MARKRVAAQGLLKEEKQMDTDNNSGARSVTPPENEKITSAMRQRPEVPSESTGLSQRVKDWADFANKAVMTIAFLAGGLWALVLFFETTFPGLTPKVSVETSLAWTRLEAENSVAPASCQGDFSVTVRNTSQKPLAITNVQMDIWTKNLSDEGEISKLNQLNALTPVDLGIADRKTGLQSDLLTKDIEANYSPGESNSSHLLFLFPNKPNTLAIIKVRVQGHGLVPLLGPTLSSWIGTSLDNYGYVIERMCRENNN